MRHADPTPLFADLAPCFPEASQDPSPDRPAEPTPPPPRRKPRVNRPNRTQVHVYCESLDQRLDDEHTARLVWQVVEQLDLTALYDQIKAVEGVAGRNASDPRVLFALCLYAAFDSVTSARALAHLCYDSRPYEWLRGAVPVNYHLLADFRVQHGDLLKALHTDVLTGLLAEGLVALECVAQDGMRVRASAGSDSFRRRPTLEEAQRIACDYLDRLERQAKTDADADADADAAAARLTLRQQKARERAARERAERIEQALAAVEELAEQRERRKKGDGATARASTTDPEARKMKMPDGGFRPAYNVQMATDTNSGVIVSMDVTNEGTDAGQLAPRMAEIETDLGQRPQQALVDGGFGALADIEATETGGTTVYAPVKKEEKHRAQGTDPFAPRPGDSPIIAAWRKRMGTPEAQALYKRRAATAELSNARLRNQGVYQVRVRGLVKVKAALWWHVLAVNLLRAAKLRAQRAAQAQQAAVPPGARCAPGP